jgi:hypothetical protein
MSSSINLNLDGIGDEIAVAVAEAMRKQLATFQCQTAGIIAEQVSQQVAAAIKTALLDVQTPTFDVREQILGTCLLDLHVLQSSLTVLANAHAILASYVGSHGFHQGLAVVLAGDKGVVMAYVVATGAQSTHDRSPVSVLLKGAATTTDTDALQSLFGVSKRALSRAWELRGDLGGFCDLRALDT